VWAWFDCFQFLFDLGGHVGVCDLQYFNGYPSELAYRTLLEVDGIVRYGAGWLFDFRGVGMA
jgi:hypothetical protein